MRTILRSTALILVVLAVLAPLAASASDGPCPDDPVASQDCNTEAPPFYVVVNRSFEDLDRPGTGCQPIILDNPDLECCDAPPPELEGTVCPMLAEEVDWVSDAQTEIVYEMCCDCSTDPDGAWRFRIRLLYEDGTCPIDPQNPDCYSGLPPGTGIDLPAPLIVGGLAIIGAGLLAMGVLVRRRAVKAA
jgi:hypothetical protein